MGREFDRGRVAELGWGQGARCAGSLGDSPRAADGGSPGRLLAHQRGTPGRRMAREAVHPIRVPHGVRSPVELEGEGMAEALETIEQVFLAFWRELQPDIQCLGVEVLPTNRITLADIELYQRFDADWVSFEDEAAVTPIAMDFRA